MTRAEAASIFYRLLDTDKSVQFESNFSDVDKDEWYFHEVSALTYLGIIDGYDDGTFRPDENITRVQAVTIINRSLFRQIEHGDIPEDLVPDYTDLDTSYWGYDAIIEASTEHEYMQKDNFYEIWEHPRFRINK